MNYNGFCGEQECKENQQNCKRLIKKLSDEEIMKKVVSVFGNCGYDTYFESQWIDFARAIIKEITE